MFIKSLINSLETSVIIYVTRNFNSLYDKITTGVPEMRRI